jgi:hypothetical protein
MQRVHTRRLREMVLTSSALVLLGGIVAAPAAATGPSASTLWARAVSAAQAAGSLHYVAKTITSDGTTVTIVGDVNRVEGTQQITLRSGSHPTSTADNGSVTVTLVGHTAYVKGDSGGLQWAMGMPASEGDAEAGKWISITPSAPDDLYATTSAALTTASVIDNFDMKGPYTLGTHGRVSHNRVVAVHGYVRGVGKVTVPQIFEIKSSGRPLPLASTSPPVGTKVEQTQNLYSRWGESVSVSAPSGALPITRLLNPTTTTAPQVVTAAATSISTAPPRGSDATPTAERV